MKRLMISISLTALFFASCSVEEAEPVVTDGSHFVLTGDAYTATKVSIGEGDNDVYPLLWTEGDVISINSKDASVSGAFTDQLADLYSASAGSSRGTFITRNSVNPSSDMNLLILYPGETMSYRNGAVTGTVSSVQTQNSANSSAHVGKNCFAIAETSVYAGQTEGVTFSLNHKTAFVKVVLKKSSDYAAYRLSGITLTTNDHALSGSVSYDLGTGEMSYSGFSTSVGATVNGGLSLAEEQAVYFTALPDDLRGTQVTVTVNVLNSDGIEGSLPPFVINGGKLDAYCLSVIELELSNSYGDWYNPIEVRNLLNHWAYGDENTYFIEQPETGSGHINIDVRARGDESKVREPKYYALLTGSSEKDGAKLCYLPDGTDTVQSIPTNKVNSDYTIDVYCYGQNEGAGTWATVGIYDEDYTLLWSFMIWKYLAGDEPQDVAYSTGHTFLDRHIGSAYSNKLAAQNGTWDGTAAYFQFGRKDPFPWDQSSAFTIMGYVEGSDFEIGIDNPTTLYVHGGNSDWKDVTGDGNSDNLWGGQFGGVETSLTVGTKTIFDPCPKGYQVPAYDFINTITSQTFWEVETAGGNTTNLANINTSSPFYADGQSVLVYQLANGSNDYWPFMEALNGRVADSWEFWDENEGNGNGRSVDNKKYELAYWTCNLRSGQDGVGMARVVRYYELSSARNHYASQDRSAPSCVRCVKIN